MSTELPVIPAGAGTSLWRFGRSGAADLDGDGDPELIFVDNNAYMFAVARNRARFGNSSGTTSAINPVLTGGLPTPGNNSFSISVAGVPANTLALLALSLAMNPAGNTSPILVDLSPASLVLPLMLGLTQTNALYTATMPLPIPANPALIGSVAFAQWGLLNPLAPLGVALSRGATFIIW